MTDTAANISVTPAGRIRIFFMFVVFCWIGIPAILPAQTQIRGDRFYTWFGFDGLRHARFCGEIDSATAAPTSYGVTFDESGQPTAVYRYYFGNLDSRGEWAIMRFSRDSTRSGGMIVTRTWHLPNGEPFRIGVAHGEQTLYDSSGALLLVQSVDRTGERVDRVNAVTRQLFREHPEGGLIQEWRYSNNRQFPGSEVDVWNSQVGPLSDDAWFRRLWIDSSGFVVREYPLGLDMKPLAFIDGVEMKVYTRNDCGLPVSIVHRRRSGEVMSDRNGVAKITFSYNDALQMTGWSSYDERGNPTSYRDGAARGERIYRAFDGKLLEERLYDIDGKLIQSNPE